MGGSKEFNWLPGILTNLPSHGLYETIHRNGSCNTLRRSIDNYQPLWLYDLELNVLHAGPDFRYIFRLSQLHDSDYFSSDSLSRLRRYTYQFWQVSFIHHRNFDYINLESTLYCLKVTQYLNFGSYLPKYTEIALPSQGKRRYLKKHFWVLYHHLAWCILWHMLGINIKKLFSFFEIPAFALWAMRAESSWSWN